MSSKQPSVQGFDVLQAVAAKACDSDEYRQQLVDDPATVLAQEGLEVPDGVLIIVHENTENEVHLVLPSAPCQELDPDETNVHTLSAAMQL